jgi:SAM-dependent methyltransferase
MQLITLSSYMSLMINGFEHVISRIDFDSKVIFDVGCGFGRWGHLVRSEIDKHGNNAYIVGCDINRPYLEKVRKYNPYDDLVVCDARNLPFKEKSSDIIMALEIIEHLTKQEGAIFLLNLENLATGKVIVSTPNGYYNQGIERGNIHEIHQSAWVTEDFQEKNYQTINSGLGALLEFIACNFRIAKFLQLFFERKNKNQWSGMEIFAYKELNQLHR